MTEATNTPQGESIPEGVTSMSTYDTLKSFVLDNMKGNARNQTELAELSGLSTASISRAKRGCEDVTLNVYLSIALAIKRQDKLIMQEFEAEDAVSLAPVPALVEMADDVIKVGDTVWVKANIARIIDDNSYSYPIIVQFEDGSDGRFSNLDIHRAPSSSDQSAEIERLKAEVENWKGLYTDCHESFSNLFDSMHKICDISDKAINQ